MKTFSAKPSDVVRKWYVLDASKVYLGRLSTAAASLLIGKGKPSFTSHIDVGDYVVITNADKLKVTGNKYSDKKYYRHSGYPGGIYSRSMAEQAKLDSTKVVKDSVRGMLPVNKLRDARLARLKVYNGTAHSHSGQNPEVYQVKGVK